jgi:hypothetical protein
MRDTGDNIGGVKAAWIGLKSIAGSWPALYDVSPSMLSAQLADLDEIPLYPYRAGFTNPSQLTDQGLVFPKSFATVLTSDSAESIAFTDKYNGREVIMIYQDQDDRYWLAFDKAYPGMFLDNFSGGVDPTEGKSHSISITAEHPIGRRLLTLTV